VARKYSTKNNKHNSIIGVAVRHGDLVCALKSPARHNNVIHMMADNLKLRKPIGGRGMYDQGFYLADGTFLDRIKALEHALKIGQVKQADIKRDFLSSEDLW